ncbi:dipeptidyl peptidase 3 [Bacteroidales bacterium OttesenSCG-928-K03]|nr:dipeptidyl peptidase 3 [Bacteroidales bacterium OttesenSCG-928-L14]MDL2243068.1 dipeptidyl peptidase 3 [Bacteroidales bacterium OttesenSCG-928-K03]
MLKTFKLIAIMIVGITLVTSCKTNASNNEPTEEINNEFKWQIDQFDDIRVMRYQIPDWESLTLKQKEFIYYLSEATYWGRDILADQFFKHNLLIRKTLEGIYTTYEGDKTSAEWLAFEKYLKKVWFANGIHHHYSNDKFIPEFSEEYFRHLVIDSENGYIAFPEGIKFSTFLDNLCAIIFDPNLYASKNNTNPGADIIAESCVNFYENLTEKEVVDFYNKMSVPDEARPISKGLNSKLVKDPRTGSIVEFTYKIGGMYNNAIVKIVENLEKAAKLAETPTQQKEIEKLIEYYTTGDLTTWDEYNVIWVENTEPRVDYVNGFIENYGDPLGFKATWEAVVNFKDLEATAKTELISANAQWFEDHSPVAKQFKKSEVKGVSAKAINAVALGGDCFPAPPIGINLPNADWIRRDHGSKSVTITNLTHAYAQAALQAGGTLKEFAADEDEIARARKYSSATDNLHTDLHECLGHGSGQLLPGTDPNALKNNSSALEEARADLFALYYLADPKMVELGLLPDMEAYKAEYDSYIRNGILTQITRIQPGKTIDQAHMRCRALISRWTYENGKKDNVISLYQKDGKTYVKINNYEEVRKLFGNLLAEIQRIKSEGDYDAGAKLIDTYAVNIDPVLHEEVLARYKALNLAPYGGFINPMLTPVYDGNGVLKDVTISYPDNFIEQMLYLSKNYSALPINN